MPLYIYNTLSRSKEEFIPIRDKDVHMFVCGQTVYDDAHMGHAKTYISFDVVARWLRHSGFNLTYIQNITDIDDKIIARASERNTDPLELARDYEKRFLEDMGRIGVRSNVSRYIRSYDHMDDIKRQIQLLLDKGYAYRLDDDIYYDVDKFKDYTKLSGISLDELVRHRIEPRQGKRNVYDFALWKAAKEGEPSWSITLVIESKEVELAGRPGWHIEDTAITASVFGAQYDLHGGAIELLFPHHSNEIAQAEAAFGVKPFVKYWMHSGVLNIRGEKMSKSLRNFITIRELLDKYEPEVIRLMVSSTHYRKEVNYENKLMDVAKSNLLYIYSSFSLFYNMNASKLTKEDRSIVQTISDFEKDFTDAMNDDFNTPLAITKLMITIRGLRSFAESHTEIGTDAKESATSKIILLANTLGILENESYKKKLPQKVYDLIKERESLRKQGRFQDADNIRDRLRKEYKIGIEDTEYGAVWYNT